MQLSIRDQFFQKVDYELKRLFDLKDVGRIINFTKSCKSGVIPEYAPKLSYFQPSEEYIEGLTAKPWHDASEFPWIAALEAATPIIQEELRQVGQQSTPNYCVSLYEDGLHSYLFSTQQPPLCVSLC